MTTGSSRRTQGPCALVLAAPQPAGLVLVDELRPALPEQPLLAEALDEDAPDLDVGLPVDQLDRDPPGVGDDPRVDGNPTPGVGLEAVRPGDRRAVGGVGAALVIPPQEERALRDDREAAQRPPRPGRAGELEAGVDLRLALGTTLRGAATGSRRTRRARRRGPA